jgi:hypothetical protein
MAQVGKRYTSPGGAQVIVTKGGDGVLSDGEVELRLTDGGEPVPPALPRPDALQLQLGKRYRSVDGAIELLVIRAGACELRCDGEPMELLQPKVLPSAD